jgi:hypothetical protein
MIFCWILITLFGIIVVAFPQILAYLIWWFFIFLWVNVLLFWFYFNKKTTKNKESYVEVGGYKIYR